LNEKNAIGPIVAAVRQHVPTVFVVDDGSSDETASVARAHGAEVIVHPRSLGKGAALQTGWRHAQANGFRWALTLDGDGQHSPDDIPGFFRCVDRSGTELVVGNRMEQPGRMPGIRRFVNRWMSGKISRLTGRHLPDSQCGFRLMSLAAWSALSISTMHFEIESDVLLAFARAGLGIRFTPIQVIYKAEQSKIHPVRDTIRWFRWWRKAKGNSGKPTDVPHTEPQKLFAACRTDAV
jgi:glycosyltransferase involved in cell wall biosynthesis